MSFDPTYIFFLLGFPLGVVLLIDLLKQLKKKTIPRLKVVVISFLCLSSFVLSIWSIAMIGQINLNHKYSVNTVKLIKSSLVDNKKYNEPSIPKCESNNIWLYLHIGLNLFIFLLTILILNSNKYLKYICFASVCSCILFACVATWIIAADTIGKHFFENYSSINKVLLPIIDKNLQENPEETKRFLEGQLYLVSKHSDYYLIAVNNVLRSLPIQRKPITQDDLDTKLCTMTSLASWILIFLVIIYFILCWLQNKENSNSTREMSL